METTVAPLAERYADVATAWISEADGYGGPIRFVQDARFRDAVCELVRASRALLDLIEDSYAVRGRKKTADALFETYREVGDLDDAARTALDGESIAVLDAREKEASRRAASRSTRL
jgi:hypothetical protein